MFHRFFELGNPKIGRNIFAAVPEGILALGPKSLRVLLFCNSKLLHLLLESKVEKALEIEKLGLVEKYKEEAHKEKLQRKIFTKRYYTSIVTFIALGGIALYALHFIYKQKEALLRLQDFESIAKNYQTLYMESKRISSLLKIQNDSISKLISNRTTISVPSSYKESDRLALEEKAKNAEEKRIQLEISNLIEEIGIYLDVNFISEAKDKLNYALKISPNNKDLLKLKKDPRFK